ncbi:MAG: hypothetical protein IPP48_10865 [Chitinophagaceae bacterium]|nr:hypothetical protein [Chitinophagaceae bacterium]
MLQYLLFIFYFAMLCWAITKIRFVQKSELSNKWIVALFAVKIFAGIAIGFASLHFYGSGNDYWTNNSGSIAELEVLKTNPKYFFSELIFSNYNGSYADFWGHANSFWNDLKNNCLIKFMAFFNLLSGGNYYINSIFFNFIVFIGHIGLYRLFKKMFPGFNYGVIIGCFLLPSFLYFSSGIHRDGLIFTLITMCLYSCYSILEERKTNKKFFIAIILSIGLLMLLRSVVAITLIPALFAWWCSKQFNLKAVLVSAATVVLFLFIILFADKFSSINPLDFITEKQADYLKLAAGNTQISLPKLEPTATSFVSNTPQALANVFVRPLPGEKPFSLIPFEMEWVFYYLCLAVFLFKVNKNKFPVPASYLFPVIVFCFLSYLFIGHIVPNLGAILRYRSIYLPFVLTPVLGYFSCQIYLN